MKLIAEAGGEKHELDIRREGARLLAQVDGRLYELESRETGAGAYLLINDGRVYECRLSADRAKKGAVEVHVGAHSYRLLLADPRRLRGGGQASAHADGSAEIVAPMPGKVVRVTATEGAEVLAGDGVVVVEAMKMQNEMKAPRAGKVTSVKVREGETVNAGDVLAIIE